MEWEVLWLIWPFVGAAIHVAKCTEMRTYCGTPIWQEPSAYLMFIPAMVAGPLLLIPYFAYRD